MQDQTKDGEWGTSRGFPNPLSLTAIRITKTNGRGKIIRVEILVTYCTYEMLDISFINRWREESHFEMEASIR